MIGAAAVAAAMRLSPRERWLVAALFGLAVPLAAVFLLILPLNGALDSAKANLKNAQSLQNWVTARSDEDASLRASAPDQSGQPSLAIGISAIEESLSRAGLLPSARLAGRDDGALELGFEAVSFQALTEWLTLTMPNWGYRITTFRFDAAAQTGLVHADFLLAASP